MLVKSLKKISNKILNASFNPYKLRYQIFSPFEVSDFFVLSSECKKNFFVAENTNALIKGDKEEIIHQFLFYDPEGKFIKEFLFKTTDFFIKIELPNIFNNFKYISFVHFKKSKKSIRDLLKEKNIFDNLNFAPQSRGYTLYQVKESEIGAAVHGNFGGISKNGIKTAKQRGNFIYTSVYKFEKNSFYNLVFNNPTDKNLFIKIHFFNKDFSKILNIPPMGTKYIEFAEYEGGISFESKVPITRPQIFKNPPPKFNNFDVFHG